ncbi:MAG: cytochrome c oxidase subunit II [Vicinamibacterales bacterium]
MNLPGLPAQASTHAGDIDFVLGLEHWGMLVLFVFFLGYFVYVLFRFRRGANPSADYAGMKSQWSIYVVAAIALSEVVLLVAYELPEWNERINNLPSPQEATVVRVVAEQFAWNVHYPGADGAFGRTDVNLVASENPLGLDRSDPAAADDITAINQLTLPVNRPVLIHLTSKDVIHSFAVYEMRVKQDAIPGTDSPVWFTPTVTTEEMRRRLGKPDFEYEIACSQLCGLGHYRMRGFLNVRTEAEYQAYLAEEARALRRPTP